jgi:hypothetical protein
MVANRSNATKPASVSYQTGLLDLSPHTTPVFSSPLSPAHPDGMRQFVPGSIIVAAASVCWRGEGDVVVNFFYPVSLYGSV